MTISITITSAPTPTPTRDDPDNFRASADAYVDWEANDLVPELNTIIPEINAIIPEMNTAVTNFVQGLFIGTSSTSIAIGTGSKTFTVVEDALAFGVGAHIRVASTANPDNWMEGAVTSYTKATKQLIVDVTDVGGSGTIASWSITFSPWEPPVKIVRSARTSNTILGVANNSMLIDFTSGTFTQTFTAASTLGSGWFCYLRNSGTGDITLDPNSAEQIDGLASFIMYPGEARLIQCDGTGFNSVVLNGFDRTYDASEASWVVPPGYSKLQACAWGGGGGGAANAASGQTYSFGGGGGAYLEVSTLTSGLGATLSLVVGAGGAGGVSTGGYGVDGGNTTVFGVTAYGGGRGLNIGSNTAPAGGSAFIANATSDVVGSVGEAFWGGSSFPGGTTIYGGGSGGGITSEAVSSTPGTTIFGGAGGAASISSDATDGTQPGGGGGGASGAGFAGGDGADGRIRIWGLI